MKCCRIARRVVSGSHSLIPCQPSDLPLTLATKLLPSLACLGGRPDSDVRGRQAKWELGQAGRGWERRIASSDYAAASPCLSLIPSTKDDQRMGQAR